MVDTRVARRYATALFGAALSADNVRAVEEDLAAIDGAIASDSQFRNYLAAPYAARDEKIRLLSKVFGDRVTALTMQVIRVMVTKGREAVIPGVYAQYVAIRRAHEGIIYATITSCVALTPEQKSAITEKLQSVLNKKVEPEFRVDPSTLGGVKVAYENFVLDGTARGTLSKIRERLRYELLKQN